MSEIKHLTCAETAKIVRQILKESFHNTKFSVRGKCYAGGASINIHWTDGASNEDVCAIAKQFEGASFDGMCDLKTYNRHEFNGRQLHLGADYVFTSRHYSDAAIQAVIDSIYTEYAANFINQQTPKPLVNDYNAGNCRCVKIGSGFRDDYIVSEIHRRLERLSFDKREPSKTLEQIAPI